MGIHFRLRVTHHLGDLNRNQLPELFLVHLMRLPGEEHPENEEATEEHSHAHESASDVLADLLLLFGTHGVVHGGVLVVLVVALLGFAAEVVFELTVSAHGVVLLAGLIVGEGFVGLVDFLELVFVAGGVVGVVLFGEFVVGLFDV